MNLSVFGFTVAALLTLHASIDRDLDVVEVFSGVGAVVRAALARNYDAVPFDINRIPGETDESRGSRSEDLSCKDGFLHCAQLVARLRVGGLLWLGPFYFLPGWSGSLAK